MSIRPQNWTEYIGQASLKARLEIHIQAALNRQAVLKHVFLFAPPGSGKTTLAGLIAARLNTNFYDRVAPIKPLFFRNLVREFHGVLLIDEIHRMARADQESMLTLLDEGYYETDHGSIVNKQLTIIGATTEPTGVIEPLRQRFPITPYFEPYSDDEMAQIVQQMGRKIGVKISTTNATLLAKATNGVPRNAEKFVDAALDLGTTDAYKIFDLLKYTPDGLSPEHRDYLRVLCHNEILGLEALVAQLPMTRPQIKELERVLLDKDLIRLSKSGRYATPAGHLTMKEN